MNGNVVGKLTGTPLARQRFFVLFNLASILFFLVAVLLGLNYGLKNVLYLFLPIAAAYLLLAFSLVTRRFNDAGMPGTLIGAVSFLLIGGLFGTGNFALGLVALAAMFIVACFAPSRQARIAGTA